MEFCIIGFNLYKVNNIETGGTGPIEENNFVVLE